MPRRPTVKVGSFAMVAPHVPEPWGGEMVLVVAHVSIYPTDVMIVIGRPGQVELYSDELREINLSQFA